MKKRTIIALLLLVILLEASARADNAEFIEGLSSDTLSVYVGYYGGPYYEKAVFTIDDLWKMDIVYEDYTFIDSMPAAVIDNAAGVRLSDLMDAAGIDIGSVQYFTFQSSDVYQETLQFSKRSLIDTPRYCFYSLPENFGEDGAVEGAGDFFTAVETIIALRDNFKRSYEGAEFGLSASNDKTRFRLVFGQADVEEQRASDSIKWIYRINVILGGAPVLTMAESVLEGEVGSLLRTDTELQIADSTIAQNAKLSWSSSDSTVAEVDDNGNITIIGVGTAVITAAFGETRAELSVTGIEGEGASAEIIPENTGTNTDPEVETTKTEPSESTSEAIITESDTSTEENTASETNDAAEPPFEEADAVQPETVIPAVSEEIQTLPVSAAYIPIVVSKGEIGGIQNWRSEEMSDNAAELGNLKRDYSGSTVIAVLCLSLLIISGAAFSAAFYLDIGRNKK